MFLQIVETIRTRFAARGLNNISIVDGLASEVQQANFGGGGANRVAFVPATDIAIIPPTRVGEDTDGSPRQLLNTLFTFEVHIAGWDSDNPDRDLAHRHKAYDIWELVVQEVQLAYGGAIEWTGARWNLDKKHLPFGAELIATLVINVPLFDVRYVPATGHAKYPEPKPGLNPPPIP